ncbi:MAG: cyclic nucleotide-binding domain-containing protein, partial [Thermohalobaculum sp.]|nr:cyclic nucleotide-binding domain-containing protein [Thermohalobaculum sp.]
VYALAAGLTPILVLHATLLPLNVVRLIQMQRRVRLARMAARLPQAEDRFEWLIPLGNRRKLPVGTVLFHKGEPADSLYVLISGEVRIPELGVTLGPGSILGEIALFSGEGRRTNGAVAASPVVLAELTEQRVEQLYFDNPSFAYKLIRLVTRRLLHSLAQHEAAIEVRRPTACIAEPLPARSNTGGVG